MEEEIVKRICTDENEDEFQMYLIREEGIGLFVTRSKKNYLILDSEDYWYDVVLGERPYRKKCKCGNNWFHANFTYVPREGTDDIREIYIDTICTVCGKEHDAMSVDIDYGGTGHLITNPLTYCKKPFIKVGLQILSVRVGIGDVGEQKMLKYLLNESGLNAFCLYWNRLSRKQFLEKTNYSYLMEILSDEDNMNKGIYLTLPGFDKWDKVFGEHETVGGYVKGNVCKQYEIIELGCPFVHIQTKRKVYHLTFSKNYVLQGEVVQKSQDFIETTQRISEWLAENFE